MFLFENEWMVKRVEYVVRCVPRQVLGGLGVEGSRRWVVLDVRDTSGTSERASEGHEEYDRRRENENKRTKRVLRSTGRGGRGGGRPRRRQTGQRDGTRGEGRGTSLVARVE